MASSVLYAIRDAVRQVNTDKMMSWDSPATSERIRLAVGDSIAKSVIDFTIKNINLLRHLDQWKALENYPSFEDNQTIVFIALLLVKFC